MSFLDQLLAFGTDWLYLFVPLGLCGAGVVWLWAKGESEEPAFLRRTIARISSSLRRITGLPGWTAAGLLTGLVALLVAVIGFLWDVAWHIDLGRDEFLFTPAHMAILAGLMMIVGAGIASTVVATVDEADTGWRLGWLRIPHSAAALIVLGSGALLGFPLDELWHRTYGIDVTMWGPTHLLMIGGASLTPLALWLMVTEAGPRAGHAPSVRRARIFLAGVVLVGLSTLQGEFDFGVPQFQQLYHPVLIALAASVALVAARTALGRGAAIYAALVFIAIRGALAWLVGPVLDLPVPVFPLYLGAAVAVELVYGLTRLSPLARAMLAGAGVGTVGLAAEWGWTHVVGRHPWGGALWPGLLAATGIAIAGALLGLAIGRVTSFRRPQVGRAPLALAALAAVALLAVPFPRNDASVTGELSTTSAGPGRVEVRVALEPPDAAIAPDWFETLSWQGEGMELHRMLPAGDGTYVSDGSVPVGGDWKTLVRLARDDVLIAAPVFMPADPQIGAPEVPVDPRRSVAFDRDTELLLREAHDGPRWPAMVAYGSILAIAVVWLATLAIAFAAVARRVGRGRLAGRRIVLTGASGDIGRAATGALRREGAQVVGIDLVASEDVLAADVADPGAVTQAIEAAARRMGGIDTVVNNAGVGVAQDAGTPPDEGTRRALEVNFLGAWNVTAAAMPHLLAVRGHVVHVASGLAVATIPWAAGYTASKRALLAHADTLRIEYHGRVTVTSVLPGYVPTAIHAVPAKAGATLDGLVWVDPLEAAAQAIVRACADRPREVSTGARTALGLGLARHVRRLTDAVVAIWTRRAVRRRGPPRFRRVEEQPAPEERLPV